jgi:hypothetical protein
MVIGRTSSSMMTQGFYLATSTRTPQHHEPRHDQGADKQDTQDVN